MPTFPKISGAMVASIIFTGIVLNMAGSGMFGETIKKGAQFVTKGYGV